ncbi:MAG: DUF2269 family protein [Acidimicrobiales bacterium]
MSAGYHILIVLHLLCVVGGFGGLAYNGLYLLLSRRRPGAAMALEVNQTISRLAELLVYGAFVFGVAAVGASHSRWAFSQAWVSVSFALFLVDVGILHGWIRRNQRQYVTVAAASAGDAAGADGFERRISLGWGAFNLIVVVVVVLMVFKPGA